MQKFRILVIEDDAITRKNVATLLDQEGFDVVVASSGEEGLSLLESPIHFDLVLTDFMLPNVQGNDIVSYIRQMTSTLPIIVMTAMSTEDVWSDMHQRGATDLVTKPFDLSVLLSRIQAALPQA